jgi:hypothetical protein
MNQQKKIMARIRRKETEIQDLEMQIREARAYVQAMQDVLKMLPRTGGASGGAEILRAGSAASRARDIILAAGKPVHVSDLLKEMGKEMTHETRASLSGTLAAYVRKGEIFTRPGPNLFGLVELEDQPAPAEQASEPPGDFGTFDEEPEDDDVPC